MQDRTPTNSASPKGNPPAPSRRELLAASLALGAAGVALSLGACGTTKPRGGRDDVRVRPPLRIALMQSSLTHTLASTAQGDATRFATLARTMHQARAVGYSSSMWSDQARDARLLKTLAQRARDEGVLPLLLQVDDEGLLGDADASARTRTVVAHHKWADAAKALGCEGLVVRPGAAGPLASQADQLADGLASLSTYTASLGLRLLVRNGGTGAVLSANPAWMAGVLRRFDAQRIAGLADFDALADASRELGTNPSDAMRTQMPFAAAIALRGVDNGTLPELPGRANPSRASFLRAALEDAIMGRGEAAYAPFRGYVLIDAQEQSAAAEDRVISATREFVNAIVRRYHDGSLR
jgi:hypothetical protein